MSVELEEPMVMPPEGTPEWDAWAAEDKGVSIAVASWFFTALATLFVAGRLFVRYRMYKHFKDDDYWCTLGMVGG